MKTLIWGVLVAYYCTVYAFSCLRAQIPENPFTQIAVYIIFRGFLSCLCSLISQLYIVKVVHDGNHHRNANSYIRNEKIHLCCTQCRYDSFTFVWCKFRFRGTPVSLSLEHLLRNNGTLDSDQWNAYLNVCNSSYFCKHIVRLRYSTIHLTAMNRLPAPSKALRWRK